jgi:hypothetical protein
MYRGLLLIASRLNIHDYRFVLEPYYDKELNPHVPKLNDTTEDNDDMISWDLNPYLHTRIN